MNTSTHGCGSGRLWVNAPTHFDNVGYAMLTLFEVFTLEMWPDIMFQVIDSQGENLGPKLDHR